MYALIDKTNKVVNAFVGDVETIENELKNQELKAIQITIENSPAHQNSYWNGSKFVKELNNA
jgi:hypothetical protein